MNAVYTWYDESPERGPRCGGHCTAMLWKKSKALGCSRKNTWNGNRPLYVCRYAKSAANFGSKAAGVSMPDYSREPGCYNKYPVSKRWTKGGGGGGNDKPGGSGDRSHGPDDSSGGPDSDSNSQPGGQPG